MSDSNNFYHLRKQRKLLHKHFSFQFPTSYLKFDFHLVCFIKPPQSDLKGVAGNYPSAEGKKWQWGSSNSLAQKEQGGEGWGEGQRNNQPAQKPLFSSLVSTALATLSCMIALGWQGQHNSFLGTVKRFRDCGHQQEALQ